MTASVTDIREWKKIRRRRILKMKATGTCGVRVPQEIRPTPDASAKQQHSREHDSTANGAGRKTISIAKSKRVLIKQGAYLVRATKVEDLFWHWSWHKWVMKVHFVLAGTEQSVTKFFNCGSDHENPEVGEDTWLGHELDKASDPDEIFLDRWFVIRVGPSKSGKYSVVREIRRATQSEVESWSAWREGSR
jgi:hypothetical protein